MMNNPLTRRFKADWFKKPERPPTPDPDWNKRQHVDFRLPQTWFSQVSRAKKPTTSFDELINTPINFSAFILNRINIKDLTQAILVGPAFDLLKGTSKSLTELEYHLKEYHRGRQIIPKDYFINNDLEYLKGGSLSRQYSTSVTKTKAATYEIKWIEDLVSNLWSPMKVVYDKHAYWVTRLTIMKKYDYGHLEEIEVSREDQQLYKRIAIQRRVEDLQLGVKSYQKKLNLTKSDTFRSNLRNRIAYTAYLDIKGVIYKDQNNRNRLIRADELHKFSDGTLNDVQTALHDIASGIRMEYLPKRKWSGLDKRRARVMIQDIEKQLFQRRLMRNLEKFVGPSLVPEITSVFTTTIPPSPLFFNPLLHQATPTPTPTASETTTSFLALLDFASVFKLNKRVTNLEKDLLEMKQVNQYAKALSSIPAIVDRYIDNKLGEVI
ncbi:hypothetical protein Tco_0408043 [Tanacetum coccineum]